MKHLFKEDTEAETIEAQAIQDEFFVAIRPIITKYHNEGYSIRDLCYIATSVVQVLVSELALKKQLEIYRNKRNHGR